jgi:hypothetical protein
MNQITQTLWSSLLAVAACGGVVAAKSDSGPVGGSGIDGLEASVDVVGQACDAGAVCPNGVECLTGACQSGNRRISALDAGLCVTTCGVHPPADQ